MDGPTICKSEPSTEASALNSFASALILQRRASVSCILQSREFRSKTLFLEHYEDVVLCVFQYIELLKRSGVQESIFKEVQSLASLAFRFKEKYPPSQYTSRLAGLMQHGYPPQFVLSGPSLIREYNPDLINHDLSYLRPDNFRIMVASREAPNGVPFTKKERWYDTEYEMLGFSSNLRQVMALELHRERGGFGIRDELYLTL